MYIRRMTIFLFIGKFFFIFKAFFNCLNDYEWSVIARMCKLKIMYI